jgi:hypothetical protein
MVTSRNCQTIPAVSRMRRDWARAAGVFQPEAIRGATSQASAAIGSAAAAHTPAMAGAVSCGIDVSVGADLSGWAVSA